MRALFLSMTVGVPILLGSAGSLAEPTDITVRVISKEAKFIGSSMGGMRITLRDAETGELLDQGVTAGGTGDTGRIMEEPHRRGAVLSTGDAALYATTLDLERPRRIEVAAFGPLAQPQSAATVSATQWVVPGKDIDGGDAWLLELPGFVVDVLSPPAHIKLNGPQPVALEANVTMMCGCPVTPGGLWDADRFEVAAILEHDGEVLRTVPLSYAGEPSQFETTLDAGGTGVYDATVYAYDPESGNTGLDRVTFIIE